MDLNLTGRVAVVTGASRGIGLAVARTLHSEGARVVAVSRTRSAGLEDVQHIAADLMDPDAPAQVMARAAEELGGVDVLVNNIGGPPPGVDLPHEGFLSRTDADWRAVFELNLLATVRACRAALPLMLERGGGAIVNVSSTSGRQPAPANVDYSAAKAALTNLTKALSEEFGPRGVRVNTVSPGPVLTPWWTDEGGAADAFAAQIGTDRDSAMATALPELMGLTTGRFADPQEIADVVALLASPRSASTTGADVVVDSGGLKAT
jgi:NAD(P)-dependent dehydrogenase (short-subunit alcohol dehydrogenase family)